MISHLTKDFLNYFRKLPLRIQTQARKNYKLWKKDPYQKSLGFKKIDKKNNIYSIKVGIGWRALGIKEDKTIVWFWIGSHEDYNNLIKN